MQERKEKKNAGWEHKRNLCGERHEQFNVFHNIISGVFSKTHVKGTSCVEYEDVRFALVEVLELRVSSMTTQMMKMRQREIE